jgi:hypothetical protein
MALIQIKTMRKLRVFSLHRRILKSHSAYPLTIGSKDSPLSGNGLDAGSWATSTLQGVGLGTSERYAWSRFPRAIGSQMASGNLIRTLPAMGNGPLDPSGVASSCISRLL